MYYVGSYMNKTKCIIKVHGFKSITDDVIKPKIENHRTVF